MPIKKLGVGDSGSQPIDIGGAHHQIILKIFLHPLFGCELEFAVIIERVGGILLGVRWIFSIKDVVRADQHHLAAMLKAKVTDIDVGIQMKGLGFVRVVFTKVDATGEVGRIDDHIGLRFFKHLRQSGFIQNVASAMALSRPSGSRGCHDDIPPR